MCPIILSLNQMENSCRFEAVSSLSKRIARRHSNIQNDPTNAGR